MIRHHYYHLTDPNVNFRLLKNPVQRILFFFYTFRLHFVQRHQPLNCSIYLKLYFYYIPRKTAQWIERLLGERKVDDAIPWPLSC